MKNIPLSDIHCPENPQSKQLFRIMRISIFLLFFSVLGMMAENGHSQNARVTINRTNAQLEAILSEIESQTDYLFIYKENVNVEARKSIRVDNAKVADVLNNLLANSSIRYKMEGNHIILVEKTGQEVSQSELKGVVTDASGEPLVGVTILVKGASQGTVTDLDGKFSVAVSVGDVIVVSYIGYASQEIKVKDTKSLRIILIEDENLLDEVVVVGYGTTKKTDFTGSLTTVSSEKLVSSHKQSATAALQGTIAGVDIVKNGNNPGAGFSIMVRGQNTIASGGTGSMNDINPPLYVVDGIMLSSISDIAPDDIERIDVLKDASSTAIYGSRGANGVIIVTTKKGSQSEDKAYVEYNGFVSFSQAMNLPDMMNGQEWADYKVQRYMGENWRNYLNGEAAPSYQTVLTSQQYANLQAGNSVDWVDELVGTAFSQNHSARVYGNAKGLVYSFGIGYTNEAGVTGTDDYKRYNFSTSIDKELSSKLRAGINIYTAYSKTISTPETVRQAYRLSPLADMYNDDGSLRVFPDAALGNVSNPLVERDNNQEELLNLHAFGNVYLQYKPTEWLSFKTTFSPDAYFTRTGAYAAKDSKNGKGSAANATAKNNWTNALSYTWTNMINFDKTFHTDHTVNAMIGSEWVKNTGDGLNATVKGFSTDSYKFYNLAAGANINLLSSQYTQDQWMSYFARMNYTYKGRYIFTATGRYDGSSRLAASHRWKFFPSAALGWRISEEAFMKKAEWVSNLKLRLSYGVSGNNNNVNPYATQSNIQNNYYVFGGNTPAVASTISALANTTLSWETTKEWNLGVDFGFLDGRINGTVDLYTRRTNNILMNRVMSRMNGFDSAIDNVGVVDNRGIEFGLTTANIRTKDFSWTTTFNFTTNHNEIVELSVGASRDAAFGWFVGESVVVVWNYMHIVYWGMNEIDEAAKYGLVPGSVKVLEVDGNTTSTNADKVFIGNRYPKWTGGMTNTFTYKDWSLSAFIYTRQKQWSYSQFHWTTALNDNNQFNHLNLNYWTPENPEGAEWHRAGNTSPGQTDAIMWQKTSFWKVGYITLGYDVPKSFLSKLHMKKCHLYFSCQNPFVFTSYEGWDPEAADKGTDTSYFMTRSFVLGLNLSF